MQRDEDPRDYKVSFDKIRGELGFETLMTVPDGIAEIIAALDAGTFGDPFDGRYRNIPWGPAASRAHGPTTDRDAAAHRPRLEPRTRGGRGRCGRAG